jgi:xanthosine utilization system XapX-like protein
LIGGEKMSLLVKISERKIAGIFAGLGSFALIAVGETALASVILSGLLGFFVGETNGKRTLE